MTTGDMSMLVILGNPLSYKSAPSFEFPQPGIRISMSAEFCGRYGMMNSFRDP
jgi:hypothetical protein